jgi:hypothetical protein
VFYQHLIPQEPTSVENSEIVLESLAITFGVGKAEAAWGNNVNQRLEHFQWSGEGSTLLGLAEHD